MNLGRITSDDVALFLALSDSLLRETDEARAILLDKSGDLFSPACAKPCWCHLYELPLLQHAMQGISFLGDSDVVQRLASSENQIREAQSLIDQVSADIDAWEPSEINTYAVSGHFSGWTIGQGGIMSARLYNKSLEIVSSGKEWIIPLWQKAGWDGESQVWRLEFQIKREVLTQKNISKLYEVLNHLNGLWSY